MQYSLNMDDLREAKPQQTERFHTSQTENRGRVTNDKSRASNQAWGQFKQAEQKEPATGKPDCTVVWVDSAIRQSCVER